jgi:hypothetical protein
MEALGRRGAVGLAVVMLAVLLAGQAVGDRINPPAAKVSTGAVVGRSGFAYLTGVRQYAAAVMWARLDPLNDAYYGTLPLKDKKFLLPSIRFVTWLDPTFEEPYYDGVMIVYDNGLKSEALSMAIEGVRNNPDSGWMHANYAQLLMFENRLPAAAKQADLAMKGYWTDPGAEYNMLKTLEIIYNKTGQPQKTARVRAEHDRLVGVLQQRPGAFGEAPSGQPSP